MKQLFIGFVFIGFVFSKLSAVHTFTSVDGRRLEAEIVAASDSTVTIRRSSDGRVFTLNIDRLIPADAVFIRAWLEEQSVETEPSAEEKEAIGQWPRKLKPDNYDITIVREDNATKTYVYQTPHFEFQSNVKLARKVVREFSQIFESTLLAVSELPLKLNPSLPKEGHFVTQIFETREQYIAAGGMQNSAGVYFRGSRKIMLPLQSLGVKKSSSSYTLDESKTSDTLAHEITHQVTHDWLGRLPVWAIEGIAEYIEHVPYERGAFRFDRYEINEVRRGGYARLIRLEVLMNMDKAEWSQTLAKNRRTAASNYLSAFVLFYYFCHFDLDDDDKPRRLYDYLRAIESEQSRQQTLEILLNGRSYEDLQKALKRAYKREDMELGFL